MESASPVRQSIQAASVLLPEGLSASIGVGLTLGAMMGDQSLCKARNGEWEISFSGERSQAGIAKAVRSIFLASLGLDSP
jgi:hypothetical protein